MTLPFHLGHDKNLDDGSNLTLSLRAGAGLEEARNVMAVKGSPTVDMIRAVDWAESKYAAYSCEIQPCIKTYTGNIRRFELEEVVIEETIMESSVGISWAADVNCFDDTTRENFTNKGYVFGPDTRWILDHGKLYEQYDIDPKLQSLSLPGCVQVPLLDCLLGPIAHILAIICPTELIITV
jgi:hypothetical protein